MTPIDRRSLLARALLLAGATLTSGFSVETWAKAAKEEARLLDAAHFDLLSAVADTIIPRTDTPGALDAGVPKSLDALLRTWASPTRKAELIAALDEIDALAKSREQVGFAKLSADKRHTLLAAHDATALKPVAPAPVAPVKTAPTVADPSYGQPKQQPALSTPFRMGPVFANPGYGKLKELIVVLYYISEPALTHELKYDHSPGEWKPSIPITPDTRPYGGAGPV